jgi:predicted RNA binding protein YcfA (HicA-like mRNA interferase family)
MNSEITFGQLDAVLEELGFRKEVIKGSHVNYWHAGWETPIMVRLHKPRELIPHYLLAGMRVQLENLGIIAAKEFDQMLEKVAA